MTSTFAIAKQQKAIPKPKVTYKSIDATGVLLDRVFSLRYKCYVADGFIDPNRSKKFMDKLDSHEDCRSFLTFADDKIMGSMRACMYTPENNLMLPVMEQFGSEIGEIVGYDKSFIEINRFVVDPAFQRRSGFKILFSLFKKSVEHIINNNVDIVLASVREEHLSFYERLGFVPESNGASKPYPLLKFKTKLIVHRDVQRFVDIIMSKL